MRFLLWLFMALICGTFMAAAQNTTNKGTEFWTTYMDHVSGVTGGQASQMSLYITSDVATTGKVEIADGSFAAIAYTVVANQVTVVPIPSAAFLGNNNGQVSKGIHITSLRPVAIYAHIYASNVSGATLLLPVSTLGKDYQSINYTQQSNSTTSNPPLPSYSSFAVIGTEDNTTVEITPAAALIDGKAAKSTFTITLKKGDVYQGLSNTDLTGTHIKAISANGAACKKIAVFSGSSKIYIGNCTPRYISSDNLFQQVYPTASWGKNYITVPLSGRDYDVFRVIINDPATNITINGLAIASNQYSGTGYYEFNSTSSNIISADKPIQVVQYAITQGTTINCSTNQGDIGDPEMIYLNPIEQGLDHVTLYSTPNFNISKSYINVVIPQSAVSSFMLDGASYTQFSFVQGSAYAYAQIPVTGGTHTISAADNFNAIAYGFGSTESYGYAAGTDLKNLNEFISLEDQSNNPIVTNACININYQPTLTLPYPVSTISWDFGDGKPPVVQPNPVATTSVKNGQTLYTYSYIKVIKFTKGDYSIVATVLNPVADECGSNENIEFDFSVIDPPTTAFTYTNACFGGGTAFKYTTTNNGADIKTYKWDFGDGQTSTGQNPVHTYAAAGTYPVVLSLTNTSGCMSVSAPVQVHISKLPVAKFEISPLNCIGSDIVFTDKSTYPEGAAASWSWDFDDGSPVSTLQNPHHTFTSDKPFYNVKLVITNSLGCASDPFIYKVAINPLPVADFITPDACLGDAFAKFSNSSTIADHTESEFTYLWDFGDPNATPANNKSTDKDGVHTYSVAGVYTVKLTVTSKYGCVSETKIQQFTLNGAVSKAAFTVENKDKLCSINDVVFDNSTSEVLSGNFTKVVWYYDYGNHPEESVVFYKSKGEIPADGKYTHQYPLFDAPATKTYLVKMEVYSGQTCFKDITVPVVIHANPQITLSYPPAVCQADVPMQIGEDRNGFNGTAMFTGPGVSSAGLFNPKAAGVGPATINYVFTSNITDCTYTTSFQIVVNKTPKVSAGKDVQILDGVQTVLDASVEDNNLTYKWTPSVGLNHDNILNPVANPTDDIQYTLTVTSPEGCPSSGTVNVFVLKLPEIPNTFTPNNDGINDLWYINHLDSYPGCTVEVFNRNGEKVYSSIGYKVPWDGRYRGGDLPVGVYYYIINPKSGRKVMTGAVAIIK